MSDMAQAHPPSDEAREAIYDAYLDLLAGGETVDPAAFLAERGVLDPELERSLRALHAASAPQREDRLIGATIGGFRVDQRIGVGGMGMVYEATELALGRQVALKILRPETADTTTARARFDREARAIAKLEHPGIIRIYAAGEHDGVRYIAMELIRGRSLDGLVREALANRSPMPTTTVLRYGAALADALAAAHAAGIVHRDVKASNVLVAQDGRVLLADFGIARDRSAHGGTLTEGFVGSPYAMPPERIGKRGEGASDDDPRSDVYGLGIVLWESLVGRPPHQADSLEALFQQILTEDPPSLRSLRPDVARDIDTVVTKAIAKQADRRYQSAAELRDDLLALLAFRPIRARPMTVGERAMRWIRRRPIRSTAVAVAATTLVATVIIQYGTQERRRAAQALAALEEARSLIARADDEASERAARELRYERLSRERIARYLSDEEDRDVAELEREVELRRRDAAASLDRGSELLMVAERLGARPQEVRRTRAELYRVRHDAARRAQDETTRALFAQLVAEQDDDGTLTAALSSPGSITVAGDPTVARVFLYRIVDGSDLTPPREARTLALPVGGATRHLEPDAWIVEVSANGPADATGSDAGLRRGDLLLALDGRGVREIAGHAGMAPVAEAIARGGEARVLRDDALLTITLAPVEVAPSTCRISTRPLPRVPEARVPFDANRSVHTLGDLAPGAYVVVAEGEDGGAIRQPITIAPGDHPTLRLTLPPIERWPPACSLLPIAGPPTWIMRCEVTVAEWLEFVNDPATLAEIDAAGGFLRVPRSVTEGVHCPRAADGTFALPSDWSAEWPALGLSFDDAVAYVAWRNARAIRDGEPWRYAIPSYDEWLTATGGPAAGRWIFGNRWRPKWTSSVFAFPKPTPSSVQSFPIDESIHGVHDMAGSVAEYVDSWWREDVGHRRRVGGSWAFGDPDSFEVHYGNGLPSSSPSDVSGLRLVVRLAEPISEAGR